MDSLSRIARVRLHAKTAEKRLIDFILGDPKATLSLSVAALAERAEVSYSTVCRLFPKAGFSGFKEFCKALSAELATAKGEVKRPSIEANLSSSEIMATYCSVADQLIESCRKNLDTEMLERAAEVILSANHISFVGQGTSSVTARYAYIKLFRLGIPCSWEDDAVLGPMHAKLMRPGHVLFAISSSGRTRSVLDCVELAIANGATVISLCDYKSSPLSQAASIPIYTTARDIQQNLSEDFQLVLAHALVIDILYACCYTRIEPRARKYFDATRTVADREKSDRQASQTKSFVQCEIPFFIAFFHQKFDIDIFLFHNSEMSLGISLLLILQYFMVLCYPKNRRWTMKDPKLYLAIDNCFACKRWVRPLDWMLLIRDMGLTMVEQSADTECDPLYMGSDYTREWIELVRQGSDKTGVCVKNVYSGHGTYSTCGLTHWHDGVRLRFREQWMKPQANAARALDAGFGFFAHGIENSALQSKELYEERLNTLYDDLAELSGYAEQIGLSYIGLEQMYAPHMPPWTIEGAGELIRQVFARAGAPMYITLDIGHMNGQQFFLKPGSEEIIRGLRAAMSGADVQRPWLGSARAHELYRLATEGVLPPENATECIVGDMNENPHLFARPVDGNIWSWIEALGKYSPIVHLQQSDGKSSPHWPFSKTFNEKGVASGEKLIESLARVFEQPDVPGMPEAVGEVVLTLEPFVGTAANPYRAIEEIAESIAYWRKYVPRDGMRLSEVRALLQENTSTRYVRTDIA